MAILANYRPRGVAEILDTSFQVYKSQAWPFLMVAFTILLPPAVLSALAPVEVKAIIGLVGNLLLPFGMALIAVMVAAVLEEDRTIDMTEAFRRLRGYGGTVVAAQLLAGIMIFVGLILVVVPGVIAFVWTAVVVPVVAIEHVRMSAAIHRSRALARGQAGHIIGTMLLVWVVAFGLVVGMAFAAGLAVGLLHAPAGAINFATSLVFIPIFPMVAVTNTLLYYDLRVRNEGADLEAMAAALAPAPAATG